MAFPFWFSHPQGYQDSLLNLHNFRYTTVGEQRTLLKISADRATREFRDYLSQALAALEDITLELEYRDIYDQHIGTLRREGFQRPKMR